MPFIWNDFIWKLVDDGESYDKEKFVVVRKLRIEPRNGHKKFMREFSEDQIHEQVQKFGEIETIEVLAEAAHVTFVSDRSAYLMQSQHDDDQKMKNEQPFEVRPADLLDQPQNNTMLLFSSCSSSPKTVTNGIEQTSDIFKLNVDCLLHMFKFLDIDSCVNMADVCKMFRQLLINHHFPLIRKFEFKSPFKLVLFTKSLEQLNRTLQFIGRFITELIIKITYTSQISDNTIYTRHLRNKLRSILIANIGTNLRRASISVWFSAIYEDEDDGISFLAPILRQLEQLKVSISYEEEEPEVREIDFQAILGSNLVDFELVGEVNIKKFTKPWVELRRLVIFACYLINETHLVSFFEFCPQLTCLEFELWNVHHVDNVDNVFSTLAKLRLLEVLKISNLPFNSVFHHIARLKELQHLMEIKLRDVKKDEIRSVLDNLATFHRLRKIDLYWCDDVRLDDEDDQRSLLKLAKIPNLEHFVMVMIEIPKEILIKFIQRASQLEFLELYFRANPNNSESYVDLGLVDVSRSDPPDYYTSLSELNSSEFGPLKVFGNELARSYLEK